MVRSDIGISTSPWSTTSPCSSGTGMPSSAHCACRHPDAHPQRPVTRYPPSTFTASADGASTPAIRLPGADSQTSRCAWSGNRPPNHEHTFMRVAAQAVDPQPRASSRETSSFVRKSVSNPPNRFGFMIAKRPASSMRVMFSSATRRSASVLAALAARTGTISRARPTSSARSARASSEVPGRSSR